jgi:hypothetical protein
MNDKSNRDSIIAASVIMLGAGVLFYFMPSIMLWIGDFSPALAAVFGVLAVLAFFAVFWIRSRFQKR